MIFISMVGDFDSNILPLFHHYISQIRIHILLFDKRHQDLQNAKTLTKGMKKYCKKYRHDITRLEISIDEDSIESIRNAFKKIQKYQLKNEEIAINASDGLASTLAILQPLVIKNEGTILAYDRYENTCNVLKNNTMTQIDVKPMNIKEHLILKNIDYEIIKEDIAMRQRKATVFKLLKNTNIYMQFKKDMHQMDSEHSLYWMKDALDKINSNNNSNYAEGTIFEEYCFWLVKDLGFDDVKMGVEITHNPNSDNAFKNELDILLIKDNHLHTIECKLRSFIDGEQFIYKYDSVGKLLDADGKRMIVSIGGSNVKTSPSGKKRIQFNRSNLKRARKSDILVYQEEKMNAKRFQKAVRSFLLEQSART